MAPLNVRLRLARAAVMMQGACRRTTLPRLLLAALIALASLPGLAPGAAVAAPRGPHQPYTASLAGPRPPRATATYTWTVRARASYAASAVSSLVLAGCWSARQVAHVSSVRGSRVHIDRRSGAVTVDLLRRAVRALTVTVHFTARLRSATTGARLLVHARNARAGLSLAAAGPACPAEPRLAKPVPPALSATFVWSIPRLALLAGRQGGTLQLAGCWQARQVGRVSSNLRGARLRVDKRSGTITVIPRRGPVPPLTITVAFKVKARSARTGTRLRIQARGRKAGTFAMGGPACRPRPTPTATPTPTKLASATATVTATSTPTATPTQSPTQTPTATATPSPTDTATPSATPTLTPSPTATPSATATPCIEAGAAPYLHTCGSQIVDAGGAPVRLRAVNWYGFDSNDFVAAGLHDWSYKTIVDRIKALGFNTLRIPFSNELVERDPVVSASTAVCVQQQCVPVPGTTNTPITGSYLLAAISDTVQDNSDLVGLDALHVLKTVVDYAGSQGLKVILDDHRSQAGWGPQENGLWYTNTDCSGATPYTCYDPHSWLADWQTVGRLFAADPAVIGMDVRNEWHWYNPSPSAGGTNWQPASCTQYVQYAHWGPCQGLNNAATDIAQAATQAGNVLLAINPDWLIFVEGGSTYPQDSTGTSFSSDGWGENLQGVATDPIVLNVPNRVVYSAHDYRWYQTNNTVSAMYGAWNRNFGFVSVPGQPYTAPLWVGEYGTCTDRPHQTDRNTCVMSTPPGTSTYDEAGWWFNTFRFYEENRCLTDPTTGSNACPAGSSPTYMGGPLSWAYWTANGIYTDSWSYKDNTWQGCYGQRESYGVLGGDMASTSSLLLEQSLFGGPSDDPAATLAAAPPPSGPWPNYTCAPYIAP